MAGDSSGDKVAGQRRRGGDMQPIRFDVPEAWKVELQAAARAQAIDLSDLMRIITRGFLRERYDDEAQRRMGLV